MASWSRAACQEAADQNVCSAAIILNILSIGAAWGIMELVWQQGHGSDEIWGIAATGSIASWIRRTMRVRCSKFPVGSYRGEY